MMTEEQRSRLKNILQEMEQSLEKRLKKGHFGLEYSLIKESAGELSNYDNHPGDHGTELYEREKDIALNEHAEDQLVKIKLALRAIEEGSYGICEVCGEPIPYERLETIPTTRTCVDHSEENVVPDTRPAEEDVISPAFGRFEYDESKREETFFDAEDSWQTVSAFGSSETPSDFYDTEKDYNNMYVESDENVGYVEDVENIAAANMEGNFSGLSIDHHKYEKYLDENEITSILDKKEDEDER
ncbi:regulatory protein, yteA family [Evansella caseinilytica]|uniref:Regulatory protein, yteA family n=1 Tax=Evansella caseinilytica TaxID=1503961 RepID=A0A1H3QBW4_9BACI|nr:TraR/DksA C4-type zinc finger protein [Evansella caseinilytica]SDZ11032.1 regulatory protein, yteA family [Evansella caseinilytica]